jgi:hypothetical protein
MRRAVLSSILITAAALTTAPAAHADDIRKACLKADKRGSNRLCSCIQAAADQTLSAGDQRTAAGFFADPERAEEMRMSDRASHEAFWDRYKLFGDFASQLCS